MTSVQSSRPIGKSLPPVLAILPLVLLLAILAGTLFLNDWSAHGDTSNPAPLILVDEDGKCHLLSPACAELLTVSTVWSADDGSITARPDMALRAITSATGTTPTEALLLPPSPPPRAA